MRAMVRLWGETYWMDTREFTCDPELGGEVTTCPGGTSFQGAELPATSNIILDSTPGLSASSALPDLDSATLRQPSF